MRTVSHRHKGGADLALAAEAAAKSGAPAVELVDCTKRYGTGAVAVDALRGVDARRLRRASSS